MTNEELERLIKGISEEMATLPADTGKMTGQDRKRSVILKYEKEALERVKIAKEKGNINQEVRAGMDYALLVQYGHRNPFLFMFVKAKTRWNGL